LEQLLAGDVLALLDDLRQPPIVQLNAVLLTAFPDELEPDAAAVEMRIVVDHRRQSDGAVLAQVLVVSDTDRRLFQQLYHCRQHLLARDAVPPQVTLDLLTD